jgi:tRNA 2-selenouridine synthase
LLTRLNQLHSLQSRETLTHWEALVAAGKHEQLVRELLELHYDPLYRRSQDYNFTGLQALAAIATDDLSPAGIAQLAAAIVHSRAAQIA